MAKLLHLSRPSKRVGSAVRTWLALHLQRRRRQRAGGGTAPTIEIVHISSEWNEGHQFFDVFVEYSISEGYPEGSLVEGWVDRGSGFVFVKAMEVPHPTLGFMWVDTQAATEPCTLIYKLRWTRGAQVGEFCSPMDITVDG